MKCRGRECQYRKSLGGGMQHTTFCSYSLYTGTSRKCTPEECTHHTEKIGKSRAEELYDNQPLTIQITEYEEYIRAKQGGKKAI